MYVPFTFQDPVQESIISDIQERSQQPQYKELDVTETTMKETFTNLILAGMSQRYGQREYPLSMEHKNRFI